MKISRGQFLALLIRLPLVAKAVLQKQAVRRPLVIAEAGPVPVSAMPTVWPVNPIVSKRNPGVIRWSEMQDPKDFSLQSRNYEAGETGFVIRPDGTGEFNCANVRWERPADGWDRVSNWPEWEAESRQEGTRFQAEVVETINADVRAPLLRMPVQEVGGEFEFRSMAGVNEIAGDGYRITRADLRTAQF